ncbi:hypothetical protein H696_02887 [Fonticula alba]|uniref:NlpC/P60 domain-containing protein n=1 Tax=Fonticula alba TaxID=691883 RepID=A0A058Z8Y0_FONAL|nr:hypothetical protein H696_02887 [Fonticula alba]KCV70541.1 hypothetical protein H696_02887 [Fonticula alba]|eukprot:XP_009495057.1 hypothetical protein H696_02887 [Fonticula alba]
MVMRYRLVADAAARFADSGRVFHGGAVELVHLSMREASLPTYPTATDILHAYNTLPDASHLRAGDFVGWLPGTRDASSTDDSEIPLSIDVPEHGGRDGHVAIYVGRSEDEVFVDCPYPGAPARWVKSYATPVRIVRPHQLNFDL